MIVILPDRTSQDVGTDRCTVDEILDRFGINPLEVIVLQNSRIVPEDTAVSGHDMIRIIRIAHGG